ncbi:MAG: type II toxin-antitoxin system toxin ribonuclease C26 [Phycicoccus sp.]
MICDTSGLLAGFDPDEVHYGAVRRALDQHRGLVVVSPYVVAELDHLIRRRIGHDQARVVLTELSGGAFELAAMPDDRLLRAVEVDRRYADLGLGAVDASLVVLAAEYADHDLLTLDERHLRAVRPLHGGAFRLLPADLDS